MLTPKSLREVQPGAVDEASPSPSPTENSANENGAQADGGCPKCEASPLFIEWADHDSICLYCGYVKYRTKGWALP